MGGAGLWLFHPGAASIDCELCAKFIYDLETGQVQTYRAGPSLDVKPCLRPTDSPTPCDRCPKQSPEHAKSLELSEKNAATWALYRRHRAAALPEDALDGQTRDNFAVLDELYVAYERQRLANEIAMRISSVTMR